MFTRTLSILSAVVFTMLITTHASAVPVTVAFDDATTCDPLPNGTLNLHELGLPFTGGGTVLFPSDESIDAFALNTSLVACPGSDDPLVPNTEVRMTNTSGIDWEQVWYVADPSDTTISNVDGTVNAGQAFLIDSVGFNRPLVGESIAADGIFEAGESWTFIIDDYSNVFGGSAADFLSPGAVGFPSTGDPLFSTGSIIAIEKVVPEPGTMVLALLGLSSMGLVTRRQRG